MSASESGCFSVAVVQGGPTSEAEVSRASAANVARGLERAGHRAVRLELDASLGETLRTGGFDVVFPMAHGAVGEDGSLQGLLEVLELPYVGSGVLASALAMDKRAAKVHFIGAGLPVAASITARRGAEAATNAAERAIAALGDRLVVKPCSNGSAIGVARLTDDATATDVARAIEAVWTLDEAALVEVFAPGREVTCGVLDLRDPAWLPVTEILAQKDAFYTYEARYAPGRSEHLCPAPLGDALTRRVQEIAVAAHRALGCRDLSRVDFVVPFPEDAARGAQPTLLEVNTVPGFTETSLFPEAARAAGIPLADLCSGLVHAAAQRGARGRNAPIPLP